MAEFLTAFLADRDHPCPGCGYNLRGLTLDHCPECSQAILLTVGLAEPKLGLFLAGLIPITCGLGFCGIVLVWGLIWGASLGDLVPLIIGVPAQGLAMVAWIRARSRMRTFSRAVNLAAIAGCVLVPLILVVWFFTVAR